MEEALKHLEKSKRSFYGAAGKLTALNSGLREDFSEGSSYFESAKDKVSTEDYDGAATVCISGGPLGLAISFIIASSVMEAKTTPELQRAFTETQANFEHTEKMTRAAQTDSTKAKQKIDAAIQDNSD
jgi:mannitol-specific phosphotransferase system IIBC component